MRKIDLSGEWALTKAGVKKSYPAYVPGCIQGALFDAGAIKDPFAGRNLEEMGELLQSAWSYEKVFVSEDLSAYDRVVLAFGGLTAPAEITLNGRKIAAVTELFTPAEFAVKDGIRAGKNTLCVKFGPVRKAKQGITPGAGGVPVLAESFGIWGEVVLQAYAQARISDVLIETELANSSVATASVLIDVERYSSAHALEVMARICYKGNILNERRCPLTDTPQKITLEVKNPQLWWPASMGDQPLYEVTVDILEGRTCLDHVAKRVGLRKFELREEICGKRSVRSFSINGKPLLLKGAEWLPADLYIARLTRVEYAHLVKSAVIANINFLRVWGGGVYENDCFYNLCDEYGVCVWQDVVAAGADEPRLVSTMSQAVHRLRHHPCVAIWYGGDLDGITDKTSEQLQAVIRVAGPHLVWLAEKPGEVAFVNYGESAPVISGSPKPSETARYLNPKDRNIAHPSCRFHLSHPDDLKIMYNGFNDNFLIPAGFENVLWLSQIQQALTVKEAVENHRMHGSAGGGFIFRRLNDGWPCCSPASLDYYGFWKALHYMTRRFYSGFSVSGAYDQAGGRVDFYAFNDHQKPFKGEVCWSASLMDGSIVTEGAQKVSVTTASSSKPVRVNVAELIRTHGAAQVVMWVYLNDDQGNKVSWNVVLFCKPQELCLQPARMRAEIRKFDENSYGVTLTSQTPSMWAWVTLEGMDAVYSDNFFCMEPAKPFSVKITPQTRINLDQFRQCFRIGSLRDTWQEKGGLMQMHSGPKQR